jgi:hypothetical protein
MLCVFLQRLLCLQKLLLILLELGLKARVRLDDPPFFLNNIVSFGVCLFVLFHGVKNQQSAAAADTTRTVDQNISGATILFNKIIHQIEVGNNILIDLVFNVEYQPLRI